MRRFVIVVAVVSAPLAARADTPAACTIAGSQVTLQEVDVRPPGATEPFKLGLRRTSVTALVPTRCGDPVTLQVGGALQFTATRTDVWFHLARDVTTADKQITAVRGAQVLDLCMKGDRVFGSLVVYSDDVLEGEQKRPGELIRDVELPCDALSLDVVERPDDPLDAHISEDETVVHSWESRGDASRVVLYATPSTKAHGYAIESPSCGDGCFDFIELGVKNGWVHVTTTNEGVTLSGWVPARRLKRLPDDMGIVGHSYMCSGDHGGAGGWGESPPPNSVEREGTVRAGTIVYAGEGTGAWGRFAASERIKVRITKGSPWAELRYVPGLDGDPQGSPWLNGLVPVDTLKLDP